VEGKKREKGAIARVRAHFERGSVICLDLMIVSINNLPANISGSSMEVRLPRQKMNVVSKC
jgi:hypothetical protein